MSVGDILDGIALLFRRHPLVFLGIGAIQQVPGLLWNLGFGEIEPHQMEDARVMAAFFGWLLVATLAQGIMASLTSPVIARLAASDFLDQPWPVGRTLEFVLRRAPRLIWLTIVVQVLVLASLFACILPVIPATLILSIAVPVCVVEDCPALTAVARSWKLMWNSLHPLRLLALLALLFGGLVVLLSVLAVLQQNGLILPRTYALVSSAFGTLFIPFSVLAVTLFYFDLRIRREGFDLVVLAAETL